VVPETPPPSPREPDSASIPPSGPEGAARVLARILRQAAPYMAAASTLTAAVVLGAFGGWWLDERWGTGPWLATAGVLLGAAAGLAQLARVALGAGRKKG